MQTGAITGYIDVAQLTLYAFWLFFAGLIFYLRREDKREGYPLESDRSDRILVQGFPPMPAPKTYLLRDGTTRMTPRAEAPGRKINVRPVGTWPGAPMQPTGNPLVDGVGPASYAERADVPDLTLEGLIKIVPLRVATDYAIDSHDPDPRGMKVLGADRNVAGTVQDVWVDRSEAIIRYLEVSLPASEGSRTVLLPMTMVRIDGRRRRVKVQSILAEHFSDIPSLQNPDQVTLREEDRISAYYAGGQLYAEPKRLGPLL
jgi:photosynthetic reaction center H subunit